MAFPSVRSSTQSRENANTTTHSVALPSSIVAGDTLVVAVAFYGDSSYVEIDWESQGIEYEWGNVAYLGVYEGMRFDCYFAKAGGSESSPLIITTANSCKSAHVVLCVKDALNPNDDYWWPEWDGVTANGNPDPPGFETYYGEALDYLWITPMAYLGTSAVSGYPADYTSDQINNYDGANYPSVAIATRPLNDLGEDPGAWSLSGHAVAYTVALYPTFPGATVYADSIDCVAQVPTPTFGPDVMWDAEVATTAISRTTTVGTPTVCDGLPYFESRSSGDDGYFRGGSLYTGAAQLGDGYASYLRHPAVTIDQGASRPSDAFLVLNVSSRSDGPVSTNIYGIAEDNHVAPLYTSHFVADELLHTTAVVPWDYGNSIDAFAMITPDISEIVKEITDLPGWKRANALGLHIHDNASVESSTIFLGNHVIGEYYNDPTLSIAPPNEILPRPIGAVGKTEQSYGDTVWTVNYPDDMEIGETLICAGASSKTPSESAATATWPSGWYELKDLVAGSDVALHVAWHKVDGNEDASFDVTFSNNNYVEGMICRISKAADPDVYPPEISSGATGNSTAPDPDAISPSGGSLKYLGLTIAAISDYGGTTDLSGFPSGWEMLRCEDSCAGAILAFAFKWVDGTTLDPGSFTTTSATAWGAATLAVYASTEGRAYPDPISCTATVAVPAVGVGLSVVVSSILCAAAVATPTVYTTSVTIGGWGPIPI